MKALSLSVLLVAHGLLSACGQGVDGARSAEPEQNGGSNALGGNNGVAGSAGGSAPSASGSSTGGTAPGAGSSAGGSPSMPETCGPAWMPNTNYVAGDIVSYKGGHYIAEYDNPGYDPIISSYYWEPYACGGGGVGGSGAQGGSGAGGSGPLGDSAFDDIVSESLFNQMFPDRNNFYTYQGLVEATRYYPEFAGSGSMDQRKREAAAFLANVARETGKLIYIEQIQKDEYCMSSQNCPCEPGKQYFGRGPIQISWNYNYCAAGQALGHDLRAQPELVAQNATIAWETGLWFWMTQTGAGNHTPHNGIVDGHGFGETIRSINGSQECGGAWNEAVTARVTFYQQFCSLLGVSPGENLQC
jgi:predicted chitinase